MPTLNLKYIARKPEITVEPIPMWAYSKESEVECPICKDNIGEHTWVADLLCKHVMCYECVQKHIDFEGVNCPVCRTDLHLVEYQMVEVTTSEAKTSAFNSSRT